MSQKLLVLDKLDCLAIKYKLMEHPVLVGTPLQI